MSEHGEVRLEVVDFLTDLEACYTVLGLTTSATQDEVKRAYERRAVEYDLSTLPRVAPELRALAAEGQRRIRAAYITLARLSTQAS
jgi:preprotein translocase subunit Sec63